MFFTPLSRGDEPPHLHASNVYSLTVRVFSLAVFFCKLNRCLTSGLYKVLWIMAHLVSPSNQPSPLIRQIVLVRLNAHPAQIQSVTIPARLNGGAGVHISPTVVLYSVTKLVELLGLQVEVFPIERSRKVVSLRFIARN
jgi:hypothetical protein